MKISNIILGTILAGSIGIFTAAGIEKIEGNNISSHCSNVEKQIELEINQLASEELKRELKFKDVFEVLNEKKIDPSDIMNILEEEEITF
ncbi:hypothetical protein [Aquimarina sp. 2201CG5-10]|uniref:hypothetical protein n=1 Tax=Aquimarina callyspongiae TaxID=3098150 RepID=UPI002AB3FB0C|nr:hypothetical protein [Aquimarina sp. 2201CG5-10]MDY8135964.1 hypothetical protein [Aquimarina sp. 2201CG5-10]